MECILRGVERVFNRTRLRRGDDNLAVGAAIGDARWSEALVSLHVKEITQISLRAFVAQYALQGLATFAVVGVEAVQYPRHVDKIFTAASLVALHARERVRGLIETPLCRSARQSPRDRLAYDLT